MHLNSSQNINTPSNARATSAPAPQTRGELGALIMRFTRLRPYCSNPQQLQEVEAMLDKLSRSYMELSERYVAFLDIPLPKREELYAIMAARGSARDACHLGELMLMRNLDEGVGHIFTAAKEGDVRACFIAAKLLAEGMFNCEWDPQKAKNLLQYAVEQDYAPALELMAALYWDGNGNWNFPRNRNKARRYMDKAVDVYTEHMFSSSRHRAAYDKHCRCMEYVAETMNRLCSGDLQQLDNKYYPSYLALLLSFYPMDAQGLRARAHYICEYMAHYGRTFYLGDYYWRVRLPLISLSLRPTDDNVTGYTHTGQKGNKICFIININPITDAEPTTPLEYWEQQYSVNTTLAHELAHCALNMEYNHRLDFSHPHTQTIAEGHATNCQYQFARLIYHKGILSPADFAATLTPEYREYFTNFRQEYLDPDGLAKWDKISAAIHAINSRATCTELQQQAENEVFTSPLFYGLGFKGYV